MRFDQRRRRALRSIHQGLSALTHRTVQRNGSSGSARSFRDAHARQLVLRMGAHKITADAVVHDRVVIPHDVIVHDSAVLVDVSRPIVMDYVIGDSPVTKAPCGNPGVIIVAVSEAETE